MAFGSSRGNGGLLTSADGWRIPWARTIATAGRPTAAEAIITKTRTTRMLLPAAMYCERRRGGRRVLPSSRDYFSVKTNTLNSIVRPPLLPQREHPHHATL